MKLWIDDVRPAPQSYRWVKSVNEAVTTLLDYYTIYNASGGKQYYKIEVIDLDHDAGDCFKEGGDFINLLKWFEEMQRYAPYVPAFHIHSMNPVGVENMRRIIHHNGWKEV